MFDTNDVPMDLQARIGNIIYKMVSVKGDEWREAHPLSVKEPGKISYHTYDMDISCHVKVTGRKINYLRYCRDTVTARCKITTYDEYGNLKEPFGGIVYLEFYKDI